MNKKKPWYFLSTVLPYLLSPLVSKIVNNYLPNDEFVTSFLGSQISLKTIIPVALCVIILIICLGIYIKQLHSQINRNVTPKEYGDLYNKLKQITDKYEYVECVQAYQYWRKNDSDSKYIKVNYLSGYADERIDINSVMQAYYYLPYKIDKQIKTIRDKYDYWKKEGDVTLKSNFKLEYKEYGQKFCKEMIDRLCNIKSINEIGKYDCELYRVVLRILTLISEKPITELLTNSEIENELIKRRKTGLLGSIIINDSYIFRNQSSLTKTNRIYLTFPYDIKKGIIFLVSISDASFQGIPDADIYKLGETIISELDN